MARLLSLAVVFLTLSNVSAETPAAQSVLSQMMLTGMDVTRLLVVERGLKKAGTTRPPQSLKLSRRSGFVVAKRANVSYAR
jgi:hypothetical protein